MPTAGSQPGRAINSIFIILLNLSGLFIIANTMFVLPILSRHKEAWFKALAISNPDQLARAESSPLFRILDWMQIPATFLFNWWFVALPIAIWVGYLLVVLITRRFTPEGRQLFLGLGSCGIAFLTMLQSTLLGIIGALLISYWKP